MLEMWLYIDFSVCKHFGYRNAQKLMRMLVGLRRSKQNKNFNK